jgi:hypothetical protein
MNALAITSLIDQPGDIVLFPDFVISRMLRVGPSLVEADASVQQESLVEFWLKPRTTGQRSVIGRVPIGLFRPILARFAKFSGVENLYCGHVLFACAYERDGQPRPHRFSLFLCNEPTQAYWMRLYLYCVDGVFPAFKKP